MTTATKKKDADVEEAPEPVVTTEVTWDGQRAIDTTDGVVGEARPATLAEQVALHAPEILASVVKTIPSAAGGSVGVDGSAITINLYAN